VQPFSYADFVRVDIRVGRVVAVEDFPDRSQTCVQAAHRLRAGESGIKKSSAQATKHYSKTDLLNRLIVAVVNFPPKQIGPYMSRSHARRAGRDGDVVLLTPSVTCRSAAGVLTMWTMVAVVSASARSVSALTATWKM